MNFEVGGVCVIQLLDPYQSPRFTDLIDDVEEHNMLDQFYQLTIGKKEDYINPTTTRFISWRNFQSTKLWLDVSMDDWKQ